MDAFTQAVTDWTAWLQAVYYTVDRMWLGIGIVASTLFGVVAGGYVRDYGGLWPFLVTAVIGVALFVAFLSLTQLYPVFFDAGDLARSQISI